MDGLKVEGTYFPCGLDLSAATFWSVRNCTNYEITQTCNAYTTNCVWD